MDEPRRLSQQERLGVSLMPYTFRRMRLPESIPTLFCALLLTTSCTTTNSSDTSTPTAKKTAGVSDPSAVVLVGAGDIASCDDLKGAEATAKLIDNIPGTVFVAGDLAYPDGSDEQFAKCYAPTWGRFKDRTRPAPGNHEYHSDGASDTFVISALLRVTRRRRTTVTILEHGTLSL